MVDKRSKRPQRKTSLPRRKKSIGDDHLAWSAILLRLLSEKKSVTSQRAKTLFRQMGYSKEDYQRFLREVQRLTEQDDLDKQDKHKPSLPKKPELITGILRLTRHGYGFIDRNDTTSIFIPAKEAKRALDGDQVVVEVINTGHESGPEGRIVEIDLPARQPQLGVLHRHGRDHAVEVKNGPLNFTARLDSADLFIDPGTPQEGDWVLVGISSQLQRYPLPKCKLLKVLGSPSEKGITEEGLMASFGMAEGYPDEAIQEAERLKPQTTKAGIRRDLSAEFVVTIDPADAKDHDDAVSLRRDAEGNYLLGVHIADVSRFVAEGTAIDREAQRRGFSVYLQHHHLPMLPPKLPGELCSLKPGKERLALSVLIRFDANGQVLEKQITPSQICVKRLISYEVAESYLNSKAALQDQDKHLGQTLKLMWRLAKKLRENRLKAGGVDFDLPEAGFHWEEGAAPQFIFREPRLQSQQLIEEFMLAANRAVAEIWGDKYGAEASNVFRVHPPLEAQKRQRLSEYLKAAGFDWSPQKLITAKQIAALLDEAHRRFPQEVTGAMARKALTLARYDTVSRGHFGLGFERYLHFTSPIRRYADLSVHRLIWRYLVTGKSYQPSEAEVAEMEKLTQHLSERERVIAELEREATKLAGLHYLSERQDQIFPARLVEVYQERFYVTLEELFIEGELAADSGVSLRPQQVSERPKRKANRSGRALKIGDRLMVKVTNIDLLNRKLELRVVW